jgi:hypothetical protein
VRAPTLLWTTAAGLVLYALVAVATLTEVIGVAYTK